MNNPVDMNFLKPFIDGTKHTLLIQCKTEVSHGKPYLKSKANPQTRIDIAGIVGVFSSSFKGTICICFPEATFLAFMEKMLGEKYPEINDEVSDGAGELMNIIFGYAKKLLNETGHTLDKALPSVISGENIRLNQMGNDPVIILPFESSVGNFQLEIGISQNKENENV